MKEVRKRYMERIKALYSNTKEAKENKENKENKAWNSPVKKLKEKNR